MDSWIFYTDLFGRYQWHRQTVDGDIVAYSLQSFGTVESCHTDAVEHGLPADARGGQYLPGLIRAPCCKQRRRP
jgi:hypothetical protein